MNEDDIIKLALKRFGAVLKPSDLEVQLAVLAVAIEREACAKICETGADCEHPTVKGHVMQNFGASTHLAEAIRARGEQEQPR